MESVFEREEGKLIQRQNFVRESLGNIISICFVWNMWSLLPKWTHSLQMSLPYLHYGQFFFMAREIQHNTCHIMSFNISSFYDEGSHNQPSEKEVTTDILIYNQWRSSFHFYKSWVFSNSSSELPVLCSSGKNKEFGEIKQAQLKFSPVIMFLIYLEVFKYCLFINNDDRW